MLNPNDILSNISLLLIFTEGLLSFFSPCVLPLLPIYMGYLAGHSSDKEPHPQRKVLLFTLCFIIGIFTAIFLMNIGITIFSSFFSSHMLLFARIGGILIILLGIHQLGIIKFQTLERTFKIGIKPKKAMNIFVAFAMGFTFSFAWTPCIGPALSSILILAGSSQNFLISNGLMLIYALGLTIPFLILGIFTNKALSWLSSHKKIMNYTVKIGAVILILMGIMMFTGKMNAITSYLTPSTTQKETVKTDKEKESNQKNPTESKDDKNNTDKTTPNKDANSQQEQNNSSENAEVPPLDYVLKDQNGKSVSFKDYRGKVIFLNFWATWCPPCQREMPHIQELYEKYKDSDDVAVLTVVYPAGEKNGEQSVYDFLKDNDYTMPVLFDTDGTLSRDFGIASYPTTVMVKKDGIPYGIAKGQLTSDIMQQIIDKTLAIK